LKFVKIGRVRSVFKKPVAPVEMRKKTSEIIIEEKYKAGLKGIEKNQHLQVIFYLDQAEGYQLISKRHDGKMKGVFACRTPHRPNPLGLTTVNLLKIEDNVLTVSGLDAVDGTPIVDIKPYSPFMDEPPVNEESNIIN